MTSIRRLEFHVGAPSLPRRDVLRLSAGALAAAATWAYGPQRGSRGYALSEAIARYSLSTFAPMVGQSFSLSTGASPTHLILDSLTDLRPEPGADESSSTAEFFSMVFSGPATSSLPQDTYRLEHADIGSLLLFLVPMWIEGNRRIYEAIVNNQIPSGL